MLELYVFDLNFNLQGEISEYKELQIERNYNNVSQMILRVSASKENIELLQQDKILVTKNNLQYGFIIEHFYYSDSTEAEIEVYAYSLNYLLSWRSIITQQFYSGNVEDVIKSFVKSNCITPLNANRIIPNLRLSANSGIIKNVESSAFGVRLDEHCFAVCNENEMSIDILMNHSDKKFDVKTWQGLDRSAEQIENPRVIFCKEFDNVINQNYVNNKTDYKTTAIVVGEDWYDEGRLTITVDDDKSGFNRREIFIDSSLTSDFTDDEGYRNLISEEDYRKVLTEEGKETIKSYGIVETFESEINNFSQFVYGTDYQIGDKVSVRNKDIGRVIHTRVIKATMTVNRNGVTLSINFGSNVPSIIDKIKKKVK